MDKPIWLIWHDAYKEPPKESCYCYTDGDTDCLVYYNSRLKMFTVDDGCWLPYQIWPITKITKTVRHYPVRPSDLAYDASPCRMCSNNPANGGSGLCFCTLGQPEIT